MLDELIGQEICLIVKNQNNIKLSEKPDDEQKAVQKASIINEILYVN